MLLVVWRHCEYGGGGVSGSSDAGAPVSTLNPPSEPSRTARPGEYIILQILDGRRTRGMDRAAGLFDPVSDKIQQSSHRPRLSQINEVFRLHSTSRLYCRCKFWENVNLELLVRVQSMSVGACC